MSITDELREWLDEYGCEYGSEKFIAGSFGSIGQDKLVAIADRIEAELEERYMPLPLDADGVPIKVGDVMEVVNSKLRAKACYLQIGPSGIWSVGLTKDCHWYDIESTRHHHEPTVEDVLREFADEVKRCCDDDSTIAEYAAKLRLAGDE